MFSLPSASSLRKANAENVGPRVAPRQGAPAARPTPASLKGTAVTRSFGAALNANNRAADGSLARSTVPSTRTTTKEAAPVVSEPTEAPFSGRDERVRARKAKPTARFAGPVAASRSRSSSRANKVLPIDAMPRPTWSPSELEDPGMLALDGLLEVDRFMLQQRQARPATASTLPPPLAFDEAEPLSSFAPLPTAFPIVGATSSATSASATDDLDFEGDDDIAAFLDDESDLVVDMAAMKIADD